MSLIQDLPGNIPSSNNDLIVSDFLKYFEGYLSDILDSLEPNVRNLAKSVALAGGKRIRPVLVFACGSSNTDANRDLLKAAAIIELVHVASLVHDDIIDEALIRRGNPTLHSLHPKHTSILLGDTLFSFALELSTEFPDNTVCNIVSRATRKTCTGEIDQNFFANNFKITKEQYFSIIQNKTGALFDAACSIGAYIAGSASDDVSLVGDFGLSIGLSYQIYDDLSDTFGTKSKFDKTLGTDFSSGKVTLPIIRLLECATNSEKQTLLDKLESNKTDKVFLNFVGELFSKYSIQEMCFEELKENINKAEILLLNVSDSKISFRLSNFLQSFDHKIESLSKNFEPNFLD